MSTNLSFSEKAIPGVVIWLTVNGQDRAPMVTGRILPFALSDDVRLNVCIPNPNHECFILDKDDYSHQIPLEAIGEGVYQRKINISMLEGAGHVAKWPKNMICLTVAGKRYNVGIADQKGWFYFVVEEPIDDDPNAVVEKGQVIWWSPLRGYGAAKKNALMDVRIHWTAIPKRENGLRYLNSGEKVTWSDADFVPLGNSSFAGEVKKVEIV
jgi:cold shock CspA family protein